MKSRNKNNKKTRRELQKKERRNNPNALHCVCPAIKYNETLHKGDNAKHTGSYTNWWCGVYNVRGYHLENKNCLILSLFRILSQSVFTRKRRSRLYTPKSRDIEPGERQRVYIMCVCVCKYEWMSGNGIHIGYNWMRLHCYYCWWLLPGLMCRKSRLEKLQRKINKSCAKKRTRRFLLLCWWWWCCCWCLLSLLLLLLLFLFNEMLWIRALCTAKISVGNIAKKKISIHTKDKERETEIMCSLCAL